MTCTSSCPSRSPDLRLDQLWLTDFRNYTTAAVEFAPTGLTVISGGNGQGKTNLLEAVAWLATLESFRGAPNDALVRAGADLAVVRASGARGSLGARGSSRSSGPPGTRGSSASPAGSGARGSSGSSGRPGFPASPGSSGPPGFPDSPDDPGARGSSGSPGQRDLLIEGTIPTQGRVRVQINRQPLRRSRDLLGALRVTVFSPDDLVLVKGGPAERRRYLDDLLVACHPRWDALRADVDRILRQRGTLLKQAGGRLTTEVALTLDVWDDKLAAAGTALADARVALVTDLEPRVSQAYNDLVLGGEASVSLAYLAPWRVGSEAEAAPHAAGRSEDVRRAGSEGAGLAAALAAARTDDVRRGVSTVGPHRDDLVITLDGLPSRTHASQGEQRSLALALRLGGHGVVSVSAEDDPILLLDDVFSELDPARSAALLAHLPAGQAMLTTAGPLPEGVVPAATVTVTEGRAIRAEGRAVRA